VVYVIVDVMNIRKFVSVAARGSVAFGLIAGLVASGCGGGSSTPSVDRGIVRSRVETSLEEGFSTHAATSDLDDFDLSTRFGEPVYDPFLALWTKFSEEGADYFTDEACTDPAGTLRFTLDIDLEGETFAATMTQQVTKGPQAGTNVTTDIAVTNSGVTIDGSGTTPEMGTFTMTGSLDANGAGTITATSKKGEEAARTYKVTYRADGTSQLLFDNAQWHRYMLEFNADGSGTGTITGTSDLFPANVVWDKTGTGKVTYKDGSVREFTNFRFDQP